MEFYKLIDIPVFGKRVLLPWIMKKEGGEMNSTTVRAYYKEKYKMDVGMHSYGCFNDSFNYAKAGKVSVGRYCSFGAGVNFFGANHPISYFSTSPIFYRRIFGFDVDDVPRYTLSIGNDVWCGSDVKITSGCHRIGNGAVIGAGAVVTSDVPPYAIMGGVPAKIIKYRFDEDTIEVLEKSRWFDLDPQQIIEYYDLHDKPSEFAYSIIKRYRK